MNREQISHERSDKEAWICICGNRPADDGFYPCDMAGNKVEPDAAWTGGLYVCDQCGRIIEFDTLQVVGRNAEMFQAYQNRRLGVSA